MFCSRAKDQNKDQNKRFKTKHHVIWGWLLAAKWEFGIQIFRTVLSWQDIVKDSWARPWGSVFIPCLQISWNSLKDIWFWSNMLKLSYWWARVTSKIHQQCLSVLSTQDMAHQPLQNEAYYRTGKTSPEDYKDLVDYLKFLLVSVPDLTSLPQTA